MYRKFKRMKIESDTKLDFNNVLIRPKRSTINSRSEVDMTRGFRFPNVVTKSDDVGCEEGQEEEEEQEMRENCKIKHWTGVPIISANMDTTGTFEVYQVLQKHRMVTAQNKFYTIDDYRKASATVECGLDPDYFMVSTGITDKNFETVCDCGRNWCRWIY